MAELLQKQAPVPARWRFLFLGGLPFVFFAAVLFLFRPGPAPVRDPAPAAEQEFRNARIRLQTAAIAFSSGKLNPEIVIVTDHPEVYAPDRDPDAVYGDEQKYWARMIDSGIEFHLNNPVTREFEPIASFPVIVDSRDRKAWDIFLNEKRSPGRFDLILLDCTFPARVTSLAIAPWTTQTFATLAQARAQAGTVFAVVLPQDRPQAAACAMAALKNVFGNAGTFRFGDRIVAASSVPMHAATPPGNLWDALRGPAPADGETPSPVFSLTDIDEMASLAGYYAGGIVPDEAIYFALHQDYSGAPPAWLLEAVHGTPKQFGRDIGTLAYAKAELLPSLRKRLPGGIPYGKVCAWVLGVAMLVYVLLRYFISWKPVHKQAFLAFEDMFLFTGCLALFSVALLDGLPATPSSACNLVLLAALPFIGLLYLLSIKWPTRIKRKTLRIAYLLIGGVSFALAFWLEQLADPLLGWRLFLTGIVFLIPVVFLGDLVQTRITEPVQPGAAILLAFVLGVAASLAVFAVSLFFPPGPIFFAAAICGFRLVFLDD